MKKSLVLHLGNANPRYIYTIEGRPLSAPDCVRDLGVTMSKNLFFHNHIRQMWLWKNRFFDYKQFTTKICNIVRKCFHYIDEFTLKTLYLTYLRPTIEYGSALWAPHNKSEIDSLQSLQDKALTLCHNNIALENLEDRRVRNDLTWYFSILRNFTKLDATNLFNVNMRNNHRSHKLSLNTPIIRTSVFKYALPQRRILQWNALPNNIVCSNSVR